ncbi:hypothetical protein [Spiroplasma ixodetis]|nr:hypothetical protein [Spiroplasma ixodetis]
MEKFNVTFRTLQRNITFINTMLIKISNCNISRKQDYFVINGDNEIVAINTLLTQFIHISNEYPFVRMSNLFLICVWQKKYLSSEWLINISNTNKYNLKKDIIYLNNFFFEQNLRLKLKFEHNKGFQLDGYEWHLRFITAIIIKLISKDKKNLLTNDKVLTYIYKKIEIIMINIGYKKYYDDQLIWFLTIHVRKIKLNFFLEKDEQIEFNLNLSIKREVEHFRLIIAKEFAIEFDKFETNYFNFICLLNIKVDSQLFPNITSEISNITQKTFIKKYNLNLEFLDIDECSIIKNHIYEKILLINQLLPIPNYEFPIILLYIKNPLIFQNKFKIHFIFILFTNKNNTQNYNWINLWISLFKKMINTNIKSISHIYKIIQSIMTI